MILIIKIIILGLIIFIVRLMFIIFFQEEDKKIGKMKEIIDFIEYLRIFSCSMKMSIRDIIEKYNFKYTCVKNIFEKLLVELQNEQYTIEDNYLYVGYIKNQIYTPNEFNIKLCSILEYYGVCMSDILNKKLLQTKSELERYLNTYELEYKERKILLNRLSFMLGCFITVILI